MVLSLAAVLAACRALHPGPDAYFFADVPTGLSKLLPVPAGNQLTAAKVDLGRRLFFDPQLSRDGTLACASCHVPANAFTDGRPVAVGIDGAAGRRNVPSLLNRAYTRRLFWDGRAASLEAQALEPMTNPAELGNTHEEVLRRLNADPAYRQPFRRAYGTPEATIARVARALASFERVLVSGDTPYDRWMVYRDSTALPPSALRGLELFRGKANCIVCHTGLLFTDGQFHNTGVGSGRVPSDLGRYEVTARPADRGRFRTPTLRDLAYTAPYMHDGSMATLEAVIDHYNQGGTSNPYLDGALAPLHLSEEEQEDLKAFLLTLSSDQVPQSLPGVQAER